MSSNLTQSVVSSHGYGDASIFFLGGHPLREDIQQGLALSGHQESTLNTFLAPQKLNIRQCYRSLFIKEPLEYAGMNPKRLREAYSKVDIEGYKKLLYEEIEYIKPCVIVPLDDLALSVVYPHINTIRKPKGRKYWLNCYRGSILPFNEVWQHELGDSYIRVIPTFGPQMLYNDWTARSYVSIDFKRIAENQFNRTKVEEFGFCWIAKTADVLGKFLNRVYENKPKRLTFDFETMGGLAICVSLCFDSYESVTVPLLDPDINKAELALMWKMLGRLFSDKDIEKSNQNIKYDWIIGDRHGLNIANVRSDTMLKGNLLYPELPRGLDFWTSIYTLIPYYKDEGREYNPKIHSRDRLYLYCAKDSLAASVIAEKQDEELIEAGLKDFYEQEIAPSILIYKNIDETGILIDESVRIRKINKYVMWFNNNLEILRKLTNDDAFNPGSYIHVGRLIYEILGFPVHRKMNPNTGKHAYKTDKDTLDELLINVGENTKSGKLGVEILNRIIVCRKLLKVIELLETPLFLGNIFKGAYNIAGTETGRTSCSKTIDEYLLLPDEIKGNKTRQTKRLGRTLQTIAKHGFSIDGEIFDDIDSTEIGHDIREIFVPHKDFCFIDIDGSQAEDRVVCVLAEDYDALADCDKKPKKHAKTAAMLFGINAEDITETSPKIPKIGMTYYDMGKRTRHAGNYDETAFNISRRTHLSLQFCTEKLNKFHEVNYKIRGIYHAEIREFIERNRYLRTPLSRRRDFFARLDNSLYKEGFAYIPQSTVSDVTKFTMWRVAEAMPGYMDKYFFLVESHDGILAEVHKDFKEVYRHTFKNCYERPINFTNCSLARDFELTIPVEVSMSDTNWKEMKKIIS